MAKNKNPLQAGLSQAVKNLESDPAKTWRTRLDIPTTNEELHDWVYKHLNIKIPPKSCCPEHTAPLDAFADAYFARYPRAVWLASRLCGKTVLLAALSLTEAITLSASVTLLGGSGEQSQRVKEYFSGESTNLPNSFWGAPDAPLWLRDEGRSTKRRTYLKNSGHVAALMSSGTSVRGPHPNRVRGDEIDETSPDLWDAAQGQATEARGIRENVVGSSTWHHPDGTMTRELKDARKNGWPIYKWCWRCVLEENDGWLSRAFIERKRSAMTERNWEIEFELSRPSPDSSFIVQEAIDFTFDSDLGEASGELNEQYVFEEPEEGAEYAIGADWAKERDRTIIVTLRTDCDPMRVVQYAHLGHISFPAMVDAFNETARKYDAYACHDATGLGAVIHDYIEVVSEGVVLQGKRRSRTFSDYVRALENSEIKSPDIEYMREEHQYAITQDFYGSGHPPDSVVAMALAYRASETLDIVY